PLQALLAHGGGVLGGAGGAQGAEAAEIGIHAAEAVGGREVDGAGMVEVEPERAGREGREHGCSFIGGRSSRVEFVAGGVVSGGGVRGGWGRRGVSGPAGPGVGPDRRALRSSSSRAMRLLSRPTAMSIARPAP